MVRPTKASRLGSIVDLSVKEFRSQPSIPTRPSPTHREVEIEDLKAMQLDHPKVVRQKLAPKNPLTPEKMVLPKISEQENREFTRVSTRVVMEQFGKPEKFAPYPPRKAKKSTMPAERRFRRAAEETDRSQLRESQMNKKPTGKSAWVGVCAACSRWFGRLREQSFIVREWHGSVVSPEPVCVLRESRGKSLCPLAESVRCRTPDSYCNCCIRC
jgi:hypothetical protein